MTWQLWAMVIATAAQCVAAIAILTISRRSVRRNRAFLERVHRDIEDAEGHADNVEKMAMLFAAWGMVWGAEVERRRLFGEAARRIYEGGGK